MQNIRTATVLWGILIILNAVDFYLTRQLIEIHGYGVELNPLLNYLLHLTDTVFVILIIKSAALVLFSVFYFKLNDTHKYMTESRVRRILWCMCGVFAYVIIHSLQVLSVS